MDTKKIKRIVAREGLILLGIIGVGFSVIATSDLYFRHKYKLGRDYYAEEIEHKSSVKQDIFDKIYPEYQKEMAEKERGRAVSIGFFILLLGYPAYLLVRFIIWAVKTLKGKT
jgi:hypothetical protein